MRTSKIVDIFEEKKFVFDNILRTVIEFRLVFESFDIPFGNYMKASKDSVVESIILFDYRYKLSAYFVQSIMFSIMIVLTISILLHIT